MSRERKLTHEERMIWGRVARTARPLAGREDIEDWLDVDREPKPDRAKNSRSPVSKPDSPGPKTPRSPGPSGGLNPIERPVKRKIARGRLPLEARIDLHGLMQAEAHDLLRAFILRARARGLRHVLVITGKGTSRGGEGVLRRAVPQWLSTADFRPLISGYETAARGHGGEGALYIRLKRRSGDGQ